MELHEVVEAKYVKGFNVRFTFDDLTKGELDLEQFLGKGVFEPLQKIENFKRFSVDSNLGTITWFNGADISPDTLYQTIQKNNKFK